MKFSLLKKISKSLGAEGFVVSDRKDLLNVLKEAMRVEKPVVVDVHIDPRSVPIPYQRLYGIESF